MPREGQNDLQKLPFWSTGSISLLNARAIAFLLFLPAAMKQAMLPYTKPSNAINKTGRISRESLPEATIAMHVARMRGMIPAVILLFLLFDKYFLSTVLVFER